LQKLQLPITVLDGVSKHLLEMKTFIQRLDCSQNLKQCFVLFEMERNIIFHT